MTPPKTPMTAEQKAAEYAEKVFCDNEMTQLFDTNWFRMCEDAFLAGHKAVAEQARRDAIDEINAVKALKTKPEQEGSGG